MNQNRARTFSPSIFFLTAIIGLAFIPLIVIQPNFSRFQFSGQRDVIGALFCAMCASGIVAIFYPSKCRNVFQHTSKLPAKPNMPVDLLRIEGHHPACQNFAGNRITVGGVAFCAACSGLLFGSIFAIAGSIFYFFFYWNLTFNGVWLVVLGEILMVLGLGQIWFAGFVKVMLNAIFVVGSFVVLAAVDSTAKSLFLDLYVLGLILFLLWFRISLSEWSNMRTCLRCQSCFQSTSSVSSPSIDRA